MRGDGGREWWFETGEGTLGLGRAYLAESLLELLAPHVNGSRDAFVQRGMSLFWGWANWSYDSRKSLYTLGVRPKPRWSSRTQRYLSRSYD